MAQRLTAAQFAMTYGVALVAMLVLDGLWLGWLARDFYKREMGELMTDSVRLLPAAAFYLLYPLGLTYLALMQPPDSMGQALLRCAVVGLVGYGTYDLTAMSVVRGFGTQLGLVDIAWGTFASTVAGGLAYRLMMAR